MALRQSQVQYDSKMANIRRATVALLLICFLLAAVEAQKKGKKTTKPPKRRTMTTTPKPLTVVEKIDRARRNVAKPDSVAQDFTNQLRSQMDWEYLLSPAPLSIGILGDLMVISSQTADLPIDEQTPIGGFKYIKYPKSFRTTLVQISNEGHSAFMAAHNNMDKIRLYTTEIPDHVKNAVRILLSGNVVTIENYLPIPISSIQEAVTMSTLLSSEVVYAFEGVMNLTSEVIEAATNTKSIKDKMKKEGEIELGILNFTVISMNQTLKQMDEWRKQAEKSFESAEKDLDKFKNELPSGWEIIGMDLTETLSRSVGNFFHGILNPLHGIVGVFSNARNSWGSPSEPKTTESPKDNLLAWSYSLTKKEKEVTKVGGIANNLQTKYSNFSALNTAQNGIYSSEKDEERLSTISSDDCIPLEDLIKTGIEAVVSLGKLANCPPRTHDNEESGSVADGVQQNSTANQQTNDCEENHVRMQMDAFINEAKRLQFFVSSGREAVPSRTPNQPNVPEPQDDRASSKIIANAKFKIQMAQHTLKDTRESMERSREAMVKKNDEYIEALSKMQRLKVEDLRYDEAIELLQEGLVKLAELKEHWTKLVLFFKAISNLIEITLNNQLKNFINTTTTSAKTLEQGLNPKVVFNKVVTDMIYLQITKASQTAGLVNSMASIYVDVSTKHIMPNIAGLSRLIAVDKKKDNVQLLRNNLVRKCKDSSNAIVDLIMKEKGKILSQVAARANQIRAEYAFLDEYQIEYEDDDAKEDDDDKEDQLQDFVK